MDWMDGWIPIDGGREGRTDGWMDGSSLLWALSGHSFSKLLERCRNHV